eukprot:2063791-Rhodomonas_salina.2
MLVRIWIRPDGKLCGLPRRDNLLPLRVAAAVPARASVEELGSNPPRVQCGVSGPEIDAASRCWRTCLGSTQWR